MKPEIRGLLFDKDGTLFDFQSTWGQWASREMLALANGDAEHAAQLAKAIGLNLTDGNFASDSFVIAGTADEIVEALLPHLPKFDHDTLSKRLDESSASAMQYEVVPLKPLLSRFKTAGLALGISTNDAESSARAHLRSCDIEDSFDFISGYDSGFGGKPAPGMQKAFCKALDIAPEKVAMVGDSTHDLLAGRAANMFCIAVLTGVADAEDLKAYADVILADIGELPAWLGIA